MLEALENELREQAHALHQDFPKISFENSHNIVVARARHALDEKPTPHNVSHYSLRFLIIRC